MQYALKTKVPNASISVFVSADQIPGETSLLINVLLGKIKILKTRSALTFYFLKVI